MFFYDVVNIFNVLIHLEFVLMFSFISILETNVGINSYDSLDDFMLCNMLWY